MLDDLTDMDALAEMAGLISRYYVNKAATEASVGTRQDVMREYVEFLTEGMHNRPPLKDLIKSVEAAMDALAGSVLGGEV